ncbi:MAG TPA: flagellar basal body rod protein FlgB [Planctomycetaceae bacterium]|nr:flagellar basal body rod protein FlgB [Planctomycetaceae bacterium]
MLDQLFDSSTIPLLAKTAAFAERRHEVLAGNMANISTPDYRTRDLPVAQFQAALEEAVARRRPDQTKKAGWSFADLGRPKAAELFPQTLFRAVENSKSFTFQDGNNRSIEQEVMEITKNSIMQSVAVELMNAQLSRLQAVISERA